MCIFILWGRYMQECYSNAEVTQLKHLFLQHLFCWTNTFLYHTEFITCWTHTFHYLQKPPATPMHSRIHTQNSQADTLHSPVELDSAPGRGYVFPTILQKCTRHSRHQLQLNSDALPLGSLVLDSTASPLPVSYVSTGLAPPPEPTQSHRSTNTS
jgi:hypothetical protein